MKIVNCIVFLLLSLECYCQRGITKELIDNKDVWFDGSIRLVDGTELTGSLQYNDLTGLLSIREDEESISLSPVNVSLFRFYDHQLEQDRFFYSIPFSDDWVKDKLFFFEVLAEFKTFALLSKANPMEVEHKKRGMGVMPGPGGLPISPTYVSTRITQEETIYFMSVDGKIEPYLKIIDQDRSAMWTESKTKNMFINEKLMEEYTGKHYKELQIFAYENNLSFRRKFDLVKILEEYRQLLTN